MIDFVEIFMRPQISYSRGLPGDDAGDRVRGIGPGAGGPPLLGHPHHLSHPQVPAPSQQVRLSEYGKTPELFARTTLWPTE